MDDTIETLQLVTNVKKRDQIYISGNINNPALSYLDSNLESTLIYNREKTTTRPITCTELEKRIKERYWNKLDCCRYIDGADHSLYYRPYNFNKRDDLLQPNGIPTGKIDSIQQYRITQAGFGFKINDTEYTSAEKELIELRYMRYFDRADPQKVSSESARVIFPTRSVDTVIKSDSATYTSSIDLNNKLSVSKNLSAHIIATVQYAMDAEHIHCSNISIWAIKKDSGAFIINNTIEDINSDVRVEFIGGILSVFPLNPNINEYIISSCNIVYGK